MILYLRENIARKSWFKWGILALAMLPSLTYMAIRISRDESWDNWAFGSAQTMLTVRYWARDGFVKHKFLFLPSGYHPDIQVLDRPELRFLADGISGYGLIGRRLYYTHYPPFYLMPYGFLAKFGAESRFWFRALAFFFSFSSAVFMAGFIYLITKRNKWATLSAILYYTTSTTFLGYADSLANMPVDDFFKWLILFLSVYGISKIEVGELKKWLDKTIWILFFVLAISSYDSVFFVFFWLCALNYITTQKINFKKYLFWALAPLSAFILQMGQNIWYLGLKDAALDVYGTFLFRFGETPQVGAGLNNLPPVIKNIFLSLSAIGYFSDLKTRFALPLIILLAYLFFKNKFAHKDILRFITTLFVAGLIYLFILPSTAAFGYQGRQAAPALLLLFSLALWQTIISFKEKNFGKDKLLVACCLGIFLAAHFYNLFAYLKEWPHDVIAKEKIEYLRQLAGITDQRTIIIGTANAVAAGSERFLEEYYSDRLILAFKDTDTLLEYMDKLRSVMSGGVNFLIAATDAEYQAVLMKLKSMEKYTMIPRTVDMPPQGLALISVTHK
ncbi:MAG: hypothetical protein AAB474_00520 [Patescibacteria group bacterium]